MADWPRLYRGDKTAGLAAVALFVVVAAVMWTADFGAPQGFAADASVMRSIGYALFDISGGGIPSEAFLAAFEIIDVVLVAALVAAVMLARRDGGGSPLEGGEGGEE